uniref:CDGSH iron-sulfur domain-containing protein 2 homologue n=2 Tax=Panagrellus redivivus TaxID=6233 RepID=A0A7E4UZ21_PANRE
MTISGFFLQINRNSADLVSSASCSSVLQEAVASSSSESEMVCPHAAAPSCHGKLTLIAAGLLVGGAAIGYFIGQKLAKNKARCNHHVKLNTDKVVDTVDIEDVGEKKAYCRCWKSKKWPLCDGSHTAHNKESGDNVGPLVVKGKPAPAES